MTANCKSHWHTCSLYASSLYLRTRVSGALILFGQTNHATSSNRTQLTLRQICLHVLTCFHLLYKVIDSVPYRDFESVSRPGSGKRERETNTYTNPTTYAHTRPYLRTNAYTYTFTHVDSHTHSQRLSTERTQTIIVV